MAKRLSLAARLPWARYLPLASAVPVLSVARLPTPCRPEQPHGCGDGPQPRAWQAEDRGLPGLPGTAAAKGGCLSASSLGEASRRAVLPVQVVRPGVYVCVCTTGYVCVCV